MRGILPTVVRAVVATCLVGLACVPGEVLRFGGGEGVGGALLCTHCAAAFLFLIGVLVEAVPSRRSRLALVSRLVFWAAALMYACVSLLVACS